MTSVDALPTSAFVDRRPGAGVVMRQPGLADANEVTPDGRRQGRRASGPAVEGGKPPPEAGTSQRGEREFDRRLSAQAARLAAVYEAEALSSLIYQMGGAPRPSAKGTYVDIRV